MSAPRFLLLQMRNPDDSMRHQEIECFLESLPCEADHLEVFSLLDGKPSAALLDRFDAVLLGGSGDHSVAQGGPWMAHVEETMCELYEQAKPTFASCWGFQAMASALGGRVVTNLQQAELGSISLYLTEAGRQDPIFGPTPNHFLGQAGHQDIVVALPRHSLLLASSDLVTNQAFSFQDKPIYCTQFHPELNRGRLRQRLEAYPQYVEKIAGVSVEEFYRNSVDTTDARKILRRFVVEFLG